LLCATAGYDHLDCYGSPFLMVIINTRSETPERKVTFAYVYSSEEGAWSKPTCIQHQGDCIMAHGALVGNALYFNYDHHTRNLEYDLGRQQLLVIDVPSEFHVGVLCPHGNRGRWTGICCHTKFHTLCGGERLAPTDMLDGRDDKSLRSISCYRFHIVKTCCHLTFVAIADDDGVVFIWMGDWLFTVHLKSIRVEKIGDFTSRFMVVPYISFCTPCTTSLVVFSML
jgi:hypothetical protein